jgi:glycosyltransferase involved in cell wall biosynthesis
LRARQQSWHAFCPAPTVAGTVKPQRNARLPQQPSNPGPSVSVILPAYNEELGLAATLRAIREHAPGVEVVVVDDGSSDATAAAGGDGVKLVCHRVNRGKGAAFRSGVAAAGSDRIVIMDADSTYPASAIARVAELLDGNDYVSAARRTGRAHIPLVNRIGNAVIAGAIRLLSGSRLEDPLTGMYGLRREALEGLDLRSDGFGLEAEIAIKAARAGLRTAQIRIAYGERAGTSKLNPIRDGLAIGRTILQLATVGRLRRRRTAP